MEPGQSESLEKDAVVSMEPATNECLKNSSTPEDATVLMESEACKSLRNLENSPVVENVVLENHSDVATDLDNGGMEQEFEFKEADIHGVLKVIAVTGKFWQEWDILKRMLSCHLKKMLFEYQVAKESIEQQTDSLGETVPALLKRLDDALDGFIEGPPFTLQRLCEILLVSRDIYPNLSKLALALEKNLSVTSTLTICTDQYPPAAGIAENITKDSEAQSTISENGVKPPTGDDDEIMAEVDDAGVNDHMTIKIETFEDIVRSSELDTEPRSQS